jgi:hypothetical protein
MSGKDTRHPHRGFDNLWYVLQGSASTGHTTGPGHPRVIEGEVQLACSKYQGEDAPVESGGEHELIGVPNRWRLYRVVT